MKSKLLSTVLVAAMVTGAAPAFAADDISVIVDGKKLAFDVPPQIIDGRTMVPLRAIFEALGASVDYMPSAKVIRSEKDNVYISMLAGGNQMTINTVKKYLDVPSQVIDGRTLVPVRAIAEAYGTTVNWDENTKTVTVTSSSDPSYMSDVGIKREVFDKFTAGIKALQPDNAWSYTLDKEVNGGYYSIEYVPFLDQIKIGFTKSPALVSFYQSDDGSFCVAMDLNANIGLGGKFNRRTKSFEDDPYMGRSLSKLTDSQAKSCFEMINNTIGVFNKMLSDNGINVTLDEMGIYYMDGESGYASSSSASANSNINFDILANAIKKKGMSSNGSYVVFNNTKSGQLSIMYDSVNDNIGMMFTGAGTKSDVALFIYKNDIPSAIIKTGSEQVVGNFPNSTHRLTIIQNTPNMPESIINDTFNAVFSLFDTQLIYINAGVTLKDLGIEY